MRLADDDLQKLSLKDVRKRVAAELQRDPKHIKRAVKQAVDDYMSVFQDRQEADAEAEAADAAGWYARKRLTAQDWGGGHTDIRWQGSSDAITAMGLRWCFWVHEK